MRSSRGVSAVRALVTALAVAACENSQPTEPAPEEPTPEFTVQPGEAYLHALYSSMNGSLRLGFVTLQNGEVISFYARRSNLPLSSKDILLALKMLGRDPKTELGLDPALLPTQPDLFGLGFVLGAPGALGGRVVELVPPSVQYPHWCVNVQITNHPELEGLNVLFHVRDVANGRTSFDQLGGAGGFGLTCVAKPEPGPSDGQFEAIASGNFWTVKLPK